MCDWSELEHRIREGQDQLERYAIRFLRSEAEAQDAVQEAYIRYIRHVRKTGETAKNLSAWLYRATRNICLDVLKSPARKESGELNENATTSEFHVGRCPLERAALSDDATLMRSLIAQLPAREQEILQLKLDGDRSYKEIAEIMDLSTGNIGFLLHGAMEKLRTGFRAATEKGGPPHADM